MIVCVDLLLFLLINILLVEVSLNITVRDKSVFVIWYVLNFLNLFIFTKDYRCIFEYIKN